MQMLTISALEVSADCRSLLSSLYLSVYNLSTTITTSPLGKVCSFSSTSMGMSVSHTMDAITLTAYSLTTSIDSGDLTDGNPTVSRYGIGASYALGTGATLSAGWAAVDTATYTAAEVVGNSVVDATYTTETSNNFDIGINFSF